MSAIPLSLTLPLGRSSHAAVLLTPSPAEVFGRLRPPWELESEAARAEDPWYDATTLQDQLRLGPQEDRADLEHPFDHRSVVDETTSVDFANGRISRGLRPRLDAVVRRDAFQWSNKFIIFGMRAEPDPKRRPLR